MPFGYDECVRHFERTAGDDAVAGRMAAHFAAIVVTSIHVHEALDLPWEWADPIGPLWAQLTRESGEADRAAAALRHVMSWAFANRENFFHANKPISEQPHSGWAGRWDTGHRNLPSDESDPGWEWVGFMPHVLEHLLRDARIEPNPTIRTWRDRGWLRTDAASSGTVRNQLSAKVGKEVVRLYALTRAAIEEVSNR